MRYGISHIKEVPDFIVGVNQVSPTITLSKKERNYGDFSTLFADWPFVKCRTLSNMYPLVGITIRWDISTLLHKRNTIIHGAFLLRLSVQCRAYHARQKGGFEWFDRTPPPPKSDLARFVELLKSFQPECISWARVMLELNCFTQSPMVWNRPMRSNGLK